MSARERFDTLQRAARSAAFNRQNHDDALASKYGRGNHVYASTRERAIGERFRKAERRTSAAFFQWLREHSPWDFDSGTSCGWIIRSLTYEQATSQEAPTLPAESASYGQPFQAHEPERAQRSE